MARLVFPGSPSNGDKHEHAGKIFQYLAAKNRWDAVGTTAVSATKAEELETRLATIETEGSGTGTEAVANASSLSLSDLEAGAMAFDQENNRLYITNGTGWYSIALVNEAPSITFVSNAEFTMGVAGANTVDLTYTVVEPEGTPTTVTVTNTGISDTSVANIQHFTSNNTIRVNNFYANTEVELNGIIRATVSDGVNFGFTSAPFIISNAAELYSFTSFTFTTADTAGPLGPSKTRLLSHYDNSTYSWLDDANYFDTLTQANLNGISNHGVQVWTVPINGTYRFNVHGSVGTPCRQGSDYAVGGRGAIMTGDIALLKDQKILIACGQVANFKLGVAWDAVTSSVEQDHGHSNFSPTPSAGSPQATSSAEGWTGGAGASWVAEFDDSDSADIGTPLIVAGGGGTVRAQNGLSGATTYGAPDYGGNNLHTAFADAAGAGADGKRGYDSSYLGGLYASGTGARSTNTASRNGTGGAGWLGGAHAGTGAPYADYAIGNTETPYARPLSEGGRGAIVDPITWPQGSFEAHGGFGGGGHGGWGGCAGGGGYAGGGTGGNNTQPAGGGGSSHFDSSVTNQTEALGSSGSLTDGKVTVTLL